MNRSTYSLGLVGFAVGALLAPLERLPSVGTVFFGSIPVSIPASRFAQSGHLLTSCAASSNCSVNQDFVKVIDPPPALPTKARCNLESVSATAREFVLCPE